MKKNNILTFSILILFLLSFVLGKDFYIKNLLTQNLSKSFNQNIEIQYAHLNIFSQKITLKNTTFKKNHILIKDVNFTIDFKDILSNNIVIDTLNLNGISLIEAPIKNKEEISTSDNTTGDFFKEIEKKVALKDNFSKIVSAKFNKSKIINSVSENLIDFFITNTDYIDIVIQKEINLHLKDDIVGLSTFYKDIFQNLENEKANPTIQKNIDINKVNFNGNIKNIDFDGYIENLSNNFSKVSISPLKINISQQNAKGEIFGDIDLNLFNSSIYFKIFNFDLREFPILSKYVSQGNISFDQIISMNKSVFSINGSADISNLEIKKEDIINSLNTTNLNKSILKNIILSSEPNLNNIFISNNFSTNSEIISIKTSLPNQLKSSLIKNRIEITKSFEKNIETHHKDSFEEKKSSFKNFFKNIKDIF